MPFEGRSPMKDVVRSVVLGATMVSAAALDACSQKPPNDPSVVSPQPLGPSGPAAASPTGGSPTDPAPATSVVRPRTEPTAAPTNMPTRGFAGGARRFRGRA